MFNHFTGHFGFKTRNKKILYLVKSEYYERNGLRTKIATNFFLLFSEAYALNQKQIVEK